MSSSANASEEVKKQATHQTLTNQQSGVAYFLSTYFNLKENNYEGTDHVELYQPRTTYFA
ncbi:MULTISPECIES: HAD hydrolase family protein [Enterococcus]|uniref:HAD hydrolase family protein n=1 Tax=Enterococcus TaxID=1350 RepID=UPI0011787A7C